MMKLDPIVKEKWLAALRSGEYQQHRKASNNRTLFPHRIPTARCCINVGAHAIIGADANDMITGQSARVLGISTHSATCDKLIIMNDTEERDFLYIADYIEENL